MERNLQSCFRKSYLSSESHFKDVFSLCAKDVQKLGFFFKGEKKDIQSESPQPAYGKVAAWLQIDLPTQEMFTCSLRAKGCCKWGKRFGFDVKRLVLNTTCCGIYRAFVCLPEVPLQRFFHDQTSFWHWWCHLVQLSGSFCVSQQLTQKFLETSWVYMYLVFSVSADRHSGNEIIFYSCVGLMGFPNSSRAHFFQDAERNTTSLTQWLWIAWHKPFLLVLNLLICSTKQWTVSKARTRISFNRVKSQ